MYGATENVNVAPLALHIGYINRATEVCCVLGQDTFLSQCLIAFTLQGGESELSGQPDKNDRGYLRWTSIQSWGVAILLVASCYENRS